VLEHVVITRALLNSRGTMVRLLEALLNSRGTIVVGELVALGA
jgi:hypothetical protein